MLLARAMLDELRRNAAALHDLPRGRAPGGMADIVRERLERQALLDEKPLQIATARSRWRGLAYAAIVLLTVSVGYVLVTAAA